MSDASTPVPQAARVVTMALSMVTISVLVFCFSRRVRSVKNWSNMPLATLLVVIIYVDSFLFIFGTAILSKAWSLNQSPRICDGAILFCLIFYMSTKVLIYYFLAEKVYIIRKGNKSQGRMKSKMWLFNFFGVICPYVILVVLQFLYRLAYLNEKGVCIIGMERKALIPLISFDIALNVYLTSLFIHPLRQCYSYNENKNSALRTMVTRTFIGSVTTLCLSIANLTTITILNGEPGYICLALCNIDVLFSIIVLHWVTNVDRPVDTSTYTSNKTASRARGTMAGNGAEAYIELNETKLGSRKNELTTMIQADSNKALDDGVRPDKIAVTTQSVQVVEIQNDRNVGSWDGARSDSQERIVEETV